MPREFLVGEIVVVRPNVPDALCEIPAQIIEITDGGLRLDVRFAYGNTENVGTGNVRHAAPWQVDSYREMRRTRKAGR